MTQSAALNPHEIERSREVMAELAVFELGSEQADPSQLRLVLANYLITCALQPEDQDLKTSFVEGLTTAGATQKVASELGKTFTSINVQRYVFSLSHIPKDQTGHGIKRRKNSIWLDEAEFVRSVLALKD